MVYVNDRNNNHTINKRPYLLSVVSKIDIFMNRKNIFFHGNVQKINNGCSVVAKGAVLLYLLLLLGASLLGIDQGVPVLFTITNNNYLLMCPSSSGNMKPRKPPLRAQVNTKVEN